MQPQPQPQNFIPPKKPSLWQRFKFWFGKINKIQKIALIVVSMAIIFSAVWVLARVAEVITENISTSSGQAKMFLQADNEKHPMYVGETRNINIYLDSAGDDVVAVKTIITYDKNIFIINKLSSKNSVFQTIAKKELTTGKLELILGTPGDGEEGGKGFNGDKGLIASFQLIAKDETGDDVNKQKIMFSSESRVIKDDENASDILNEVKGYEWKVVKEPSANLQITKQPTYTLSKISDNKYQAEINWETNILATSEACYGSDKNNLYNKKYECKANKKSASGKTTNHSIIIKNLQLKDYYFQVKSQAQEIPLNLQSKIWSLVKKAHAVQTQTATVISDPILLKVIPTVSKELSIINLSADPSYTTAIISWNIQDGETNDHIVEWGLVNGDICKYTSDENFSTTLSSVHTYKIINLTDDKKYCVKITSENSNESDQDTIEFTTKKGKQPDANIVLKVKRDRICDKWLGCRSSIQITNNSGQEEKLCFDIGLCDELGPDGSCALSAKYPDSQMTFEHTESVSKIKNLSGLVKAGLKWDNGQIDGYYAYSNMTPIGRDINIPNSNFETNEKWPWFSYNDSDVWVDRDFTDLTNHILYVNYGDSNSSWVSADVPIGYINSDYEYSVSLRLRTSESNLEWVRVQLYVENPETFYPLNSREQTEFYVNDSWKKLVLSSKGSLFETSGVSGNGFLQIMIPVNESGNHFWADDFIYIDDISMKSVLPITIDKSIARECRMYPNNNSSLACEYIDLSGKQYQGWYGFCVEDDPKYKNANQSEQMCLNWWPVDILPGETSIFGSDQQAGYIGRSPLYYCLESSGGYPYYEKQVSGSKSIDLGSPGQYLWTIPVVHYNIYKDEILEIKVKGIGIDYKVDSRCSSVKALSDKGGSDISSLPRSQGESKNGTLIFNEQNKEYWSDQFTGNCKSGDGEAKKINPYVAVRCSGNGKNNDCNVMTGTLEFDDTDKLVNIHVKYNEGFEGGAGWFGSVTITHLGERCNVLAQVVKPGGENMAWASKIKGGSKTSNWIKANGNVLEYPYSQDFYPYGASVVDAPVSDPSEWDQALYVMPADNVNFFTPPYQVRAGSPYSIDINEFKRCDNSFSKGTDCSPYDDDYCTAWGHCDKRDGGGNKDWFCRSSIMCNQSKHNCVYGNCIEFPADPSSGFGGGSYCAESTYMGSEDVCKSNSGDDCILSKGKCVVAPNDNIDNIGTTQCVAGSADRLGKQCDSIENCGINLGSGSGLCMGINLDNDQTQLIGGGWPSGEQRLSELFAKSYDIWKWQWGDPNANNKKGGMRYISVNKSCDKRDKVGDNCKPDSDIFGWDISWNGGADKPKVENIRVNRLTGDLIYTGPKTISLSFNSKVDSDHLPLTDYRVDWGDGTPITSVSNLRIRDKQDPNRPPHILFHTYEYHEPDESYPGGGTYADYGCDEAKCEFTPKVQIKDNWGWCSNGISAAARCPQDSITWESFDGKVIIKNF